MKSLLVMPNDPKVFLDLLFSRNYSWPNNIKTEIEQQTTTKSPKFNISKECARRLKQKNKVVESTR